MALSITVSPVEGTEVSASEILVADILGGDTWIAAQYDSSAAIEVVYDGTSFMPHFALSTITPIVGGATYSVRRTGGWRGRSVTLRYYEMGAGGEMAAPLVDRVRSANDTGTECIALQLPFNSDLCSAIMALNIAILGGSTAGTAIFRAYIGGTEGDVDTAYAGGGTFVGSVTVSSALELVELAGTPIANPGGLQLVTLTYESSGAGIDVTKYGLTGVIQ